MDFIRELEKAGVAELADACDSKSHGFRSLWVRLPPPAPGANLGVRKPGSWLYCVLFAGFDQRFCPHDPDKALSQDDKGFSRMDNQLQQKAHPSAFFLLHALRFFTETA